MHKTCTLIKATYTTADSDFHLFRSRNKHLKIVTLQISSQMRYQDPVIIYVNFIWPINTLTNFLANRHLLIGMRYETWYRCQSVRIVKIFSNCWCNMTYLSQSVTLTLDDPRSKFNFQNSGIFGIIFKKSILVRDSRLVARLILRSVSYKSIARSYQIVYWSYWLWKLMSPVEIGETVTFLLLTWSVARTMITNWTLIFWNTMS